jgi:hypothetical protein
MYFLAKVRLNLQLIRKASTYIHIYITKHLRTYVLTFYRDKVVVCGFSFRIILTASTLRPRETPTQRFPCFFVFFCEEGKVFCRTSPGASEFRKTRDLESL